eukprot:336847-Pelagomonas_calceolata.AAC.3
MTCAAHKTDSKLICAQKGNHRHFLRAMLIHSYGSTLSAPSLHFQGIDAAILADSGAEHD